MIVTFLPNTSVTIFSYVASTCPHEWEIVIVTMLKEFGILERKLEGKKKNRNMRCHWFPA